MIKSEAALVLYLNKGGNRKAAALLSADRKPLAPAEAKPDLPAECWVRLSARHLL